MPDAKRVLRCAIYTRKSTEEGLEQNFNTLQAQREAAESYIRSQRQTGWTALGDPYDDGGYSGANLERPALQRLLEEIRARRVDCVVVYKVDRLSRSLLDFARLMAIFEQHGVSFVSVTQEFNSTSSLGRLTLHILLSFAQFEREIISERTRDKLGAARRKGKWTGGIPVLGYDPAAEGGRLEVNAAEAETVREIFAIADAAGSLEAVRQEVARRQIRTKQWTSRTGRQHAGQTMSKSTLRGLLSNVLYIGSIRHKGNTYPGEHAAIIEAEVWERVNQKLDVRSRSQTGRRHRRQEQWLNGSLYCGQCSGALMVKGTTRRGRRYTYYVCPRAEKQECGQEPLACGELEAAVRRRVSGRGEPSDGVSEIARAFRRASYASSTRQVTVEMKDARHWDFRLEADRPSGVGWGEAGRVPRVSRLMALAIKLEGLLASGKMQNPGEVARVGNISRARMSQILGLRNLAPAIQEKLLWLPKTVHGGDVVTEKSVRGIAQIIDWAEQEQRFAALCARKESP
jgi:site-specific DNA recombinase